MNRNSILKIGYVVKTHGLNGELTLNLSNECMPSIHDTIIMETKSGLVPHFVEQISINGTKALLKLVDINSIEAANELKGCSVYLDKTKRPKLKRGEFYDDELIGFDVVDKLEGHLGKVNRVSNQGLNKLLEVGEQAIMIPMNSPFINAISKTKRKIEVELPEGFLDI